MDNTNSPEAQQEYEKWEREQHRKALDAHPRPAVSLDSLRDLLLLPADEFEQKFDEMAELQRKAGETGDMTELIEYAKSLGGVVVEEDAGEVSTAEIMERALLKRQLTELETEAMAQNLQAMPYVPMQRTPSDRIEGMLAKMLESMARMEEEIMFTSSANRFAHLRSGVEASTSISIPRLPPAPDWNTLEAYVEPFMRDILDHVKGASVLRERASVAGLLPLDVLKGVDVVGKELLDIVAERGRAYGEEAILAMGEAGLISMIMSKVMRLMWSHRAGLQFRSRRDSYIDLAGYCLLTIALDKFIVEKSMEPKPVEDGNLG